MVKKQLDYLKLSNLRQKDFLSFLFGLETALRYNEESWFEDDFLSFHAEEILSKAQLYSQKYDKGRRLGVTPLLAQADQDRNLAFRRLRASVKPFRFSELEEEQTAYQRLQAELTKLRQVTNTSYHNKTTKLTLFLARLQQPVLVEAVETLGVQSLVAQLVAAQEAFDRLDDQKVLEKEAFTKINLKEVRQAICDSYLDFCTYVCLRANHRPDSNYGLLFDVLNKQRQPSIDHLRRREAWKKRKANQKVKEEDPLKK